VSHHDTFSHSDEQTIIASNELFADSYDEPESDDKLNALLDQLQYKTRKNGIIAHSALLFGIIAIVASIALGLWSLETHSKLAKQGELISIIEEDVQGINEKTANAATVVNNYPNPAPAAPKPQPAMSALSEPVKPIATDLNANPNPAPVIAHSMPSPAAVVIAPSNELDKPKDSPKRVEEKQPPAPNLEATQTANLEEPTQNKYLRHRNRHKKLEAIATATADEKQETNKPASIKETRAAVAAHTKLRKAEIEQAAIAKAKENDKARENDKAKENDKTKTKAATASNYRKADKIAPATENGWVVNIAASKQQEYIKAQANSLVKRGIPASIIPVVINGGTWYRLRVGGFKDKDGANAYANKIRRSFSLNAVWVGNQ
jgi:cell division septation protein DedD